MTLKGIIDKIKSDFVDNHAILKTFIIDDEVSYAEHSDIQYPLLYLAPKSMTTKLDGMKTWTFTLIIADRMDSVRTYIDLINECELISDEFFIKYNSELTEERFYLRPTGKVEYFHSAIDKTGGLFCEIELLSPYIFCENSIRTK